MIKWTMIDFNTFNSIQGDYMFKVFNRTLWSITKNNEIVDICYYHPNIPTCESDAKLKCINAYKKLTQLNK